MYTLPAQLKKLRKEKNLTQKKISELLYMEQTTYSKIENAKSSLKMEIAISIAAILKVKIEDFANIPSLYNIPEKSLTENAAREKGTDTESDINIPGKLIGKLEEVTQLLQQLLNK